jgi:hypothetical protein
MKEFIRDAEHENKELYTMQTKELDRPRRNSKIKDFFKEKIQESLRRKQSN